MRACPAAVAGPWGTPLAAWAVAGFLGACATTPPHDAPPPGMQPLAVRTDPPGATCSVSQRGAVVAQIAATPATVVVWRDLCRSALGFCSSDEMPKLEFVCEKEGYLVARRTLPAAWAFEVAAEDPTVQTKPDGTAPGVSLATNAAVNAAVYFPPAGIPIAIAVLAGSAAYSDTTPNLNYAYPPLSEIVFVPAAFESAAARDAFFQAYEKQLEATRDERIAGIDARCRYWACTPSFSGGTCVNPVCERQRERANAELKLELERIPELRAQVRIVTP